MHDSLDWHPLAGVRTSQRVKDFFLISSSGARRVAGVALDPPDIGLATPGATPNVIRYPWQLDAD